MATVSAMEIANKEMKKQYKNVDIDKIEVSPKFSPRKQQICFAHTVITITPKQNIHYDMEDLIDQANEIQETLGRTYGVPDEVDEADLEAGKPQMSSSIRYEYT